MCLGGKARRFWESLTVEPCFFSYTFGLSIYTLGLDSLLLQKFCSPDSAPRNFSQSCSPDLVGEAADVSATSNLIVEALNALVVFLAGLWRDSTGLSKPLLHWALGVSILTCCLLLGSVYFWSIPGWPTGITAAVMFGLSGSKQLVYFALACFIGANSSEEERTQRLTFMIGSAVLGGLLGIFVSGYILTNLGYVYFFLIVICAYVTAIILEILFISEKPIEFKEKSKLLDVTKYSVLYKKRNNRCVIWLLMVNMWLMYTILTGENALSYFYLKAVYNISVTQFGILGSLFAAIHFLGAVAVVPLLIKFLKLSDYTLAAVAVFTVGFSAMCIAFNTELIIYIVISCSNILRSSLLTFHRSIITKCVNIEELGVFMSVCSIGEGLLPIAFLPVYDVIFKKTVTSFPGAFNFLSTAVSIISLINLWSAKYLHKKNTGDLAVE
uniref:Adenylate cyclase n=1 Tax=Riptortus pedestris TaxID=329032 RepID=R4WJ30_RIPPE|nr:adenylate cyclase [Riptortus pedestris]